MYSWGPMILTLLICFFILWVLRHLLVILPNQILSELKNSLSNLRSVGTFNRISIPLIRRIHPQLIAGNIIAVQPLREPAIYRFMSNYKDHKDHQEYKFDWYKEGF